MNAVLADYPRILSNGSDYLISFLSIFVASVAKRIFVTKQAKRHLAFRLSPIAQSSPLNNTKDL